MSNYQALLDLGLLAPVDHLVLDSLDRLGTLDRKVFLDQQVCLETRNC